MTMKLPILVCELKLEN